MMLIGKTANWLLRHSVQRCDAVPLYVCRTHSMRRRPCSSRSISPTGRAHSSKPAARYCSGRMGRTLYRYIDPAPHASTTNAEHVGIIISFSTRAYNRL